jgi:hypothetical protein
MWDYHFLIIFHFTFGVPRESLMDSLGHHGALYLDLTWILPSDEGIGENLIRMVGRKAESSIK